MKIEQKFALNAAPSLVWAFLTDPYQVASCLPGAAITEKVDDHTFLGTNTVKVGPVTATYKGKVHFERLDPDQWEAELVAQGQEVKGKGGAELRMFSRLYPRNGGTEVTVVSEVNVSGILAQMGRGMIENVSNQIFQQFVASVQQKLEAPAGEEVRAAGSEPLDVLRLVLRIVWQALKRAVRRLFRRPDETAGEDKVTSGRSSHGR